MESSTAHVGSVTATHYWVVQKWPEVMQEGMNMAVHNRSLLMANRWQANHGWSRRKREHKSGVVCTVVSAKALRQEVAQSFEESWVVAHACNPGTQGSGREVLRQENSGEFQASLS